MRGQSAETSYVFGVALFFFGVSAPSYYYWSVLLVPAIVHAANLADRRHAVALGMLCVIAIIVPLVDATFNLRYVSVAWVSLAMLGYFVWVMIAIIAWDRWRQSRRTEPHATDSLMI